jgi:hypothetical protein
MRVGTAPPIVAQCRAGFREPLARGRAVLGRARAPHPEDHRIEKIIVGPSVSRSVSQYNAGEPMTPACSASLRKHAGAGRISRGSAMCCSARAYRQMRRTAGCARDHARTCCFVSRSASCCPLSRTWRQRSARADPFVDVSRSCRAHRPAMMRQHMSAPADAAIVDVIVMSSVERIIPSLNSTNVPEHPMIFSEPPPCTRHVPRTFRAPPQSKKNFLQNNNFLEIAPIW